MTEIQRKALDKSMTQKRAEKILFAVAKVYDLTMDSYHEKTQKRNYIRIRQIASHFIRKHCKTFSLETIGKMVGGKGHAMVVHYEKCIKNLLFADKEFISKFEEIQKNVESILENESTNDYDFIDLNNIFLLKNNEQKSIVFKGYNKEEIKQIASLLNMKGSIIEYNNTGLFLL